MPKGTFSNNVTHLDIAVGKLRGMAALSKEATLSKIAFASLLNQSTDSTGRSIVSEWRLGKWS